jgi:hypothetical protein
MASSSPCSSSSAGEGAVPTHIVVKRYASKREFFGKSTGTLTLGVSARAAGSLGWNGGGSGHGDDGSRTRRFQSDDFAMREARQRRGLYVTEAAEDAMLGHRRTRSKFMKEPELPASPGSKMGFKLPTPGASTGGWGFWGGTVEFDSVLNDEAMLDDEFGWYEEAEAELGASNSSASRPSDASTVDNNHTTRVLNAVTALLEKRGDEPLEVSVPPGHTVVFRALQSHCVVYNKTFATTSLALSVGGFRILQGGGWKKYAEYQILWAWKGGEQVSYRRFNQFKKRLKPIAQRYRRTRLTWDNIEGSQGIFRQLDVRFLYGRCLAFEGLLQELLTELTDETALMEFLTLN